MQGTVYKNYLLAILLMMFASSFVDRLALSVVLEDIQADFQLSDTQLGLLTGLGFTFLYSVIGIPIARWADQGNRVKIISITTALWGVAVASSAFAATFLQLLLIRLGVALGAAGCSPIANSLVADHFSRAERPRAVAIFMLGAPLSAVLGYLLAGKLNETWGWRWMFVVLGTPGLALSILAWLTLREPRREERTLEAVDEPSDKLKSAARDARDLAASHARLLDVWVFASANRTFRHLLLCYTVQLFVSYGAAQWLPTFFLRSYELSPAQLGGWLALIYGLGGFIGTYLGGELATRCAANNERLQLHAVAAAYVCFGALSVCVLLARDHYLAFGLLGLAFSALTIASAPLFATVQTLVPAHMRAMSVAIMLLFASFFGMGLGPLVAGMLSDGLRLFFGEESLRFALLGLSPGYLWAAWHAWRASRSVTRDVQLTLHSDSLHTTTPHVSARSH